MISMPLSKYPPRRSNFQKHRDDGHIDQEFKSAQKNRPSIWNFVGNGLGLAFTKKGRQKVRKYFRNRKNKE